jgi:hypothetical protein
MARWKAYLLCGSVGAFALIGLRQVYIWLEPLTNHDHGLIGNLVDVVRTIGGIIIAVAIVKLLDDALRLYHPRDPLD